MNQYEATIHIILEAKSKKQAGKLVDRMLDAVDKQATAYESRLDEAHDG